MDEITKKLAEISPVKLAFAAKQLRDKQRVLRAEPIAIVGMSCRFPGDADSPEGFWNVLREGRETLERTPGSRWDVEDYYHPTPGTPGKMHVQDGHYVRGVTEFDPQFFGISPKEARSMDPQQRLLLEVCHEALERACQSPERLRGTKTGVFMGLMHLDFTVRESGSVETVNMADMSVNRLCIAAGRISYALGLQGPTVVLDTACSSSLVTVHQACQALRDHDCNVALAGGVNLHLAPETTIAQCHKEMLSADGRCRAFAEGASGFGRGEGAGVVVLKRLVDAIAEGDRVLAVIRGSVVNHSGASSGLTVPNGRALERLIHDTLEVSGVLPSQVGYVEAQGTGTSLGDSIEMRALGAAFAGPRKEPLWVGSVKTNIGHLEAAAGVAALIKVVLSLENECVPPHLHFDRPNREIPWQTLPVRIPTSAVPWPRGSERRIAGVSAFGYSGTNVHLVVEEAPRLADVRKVPASDTRGARVLTLSAKSESALHQLADRMRGVFARGDLPLASILRSANGGRSAHVHRATVVARDANEFAEALSALATGASIPAVHTTHRSSTEAPLVALLFPAHWTGSRDATLQLIDAEPVLREELDKLRRHATRPGDSNRDFLEPLLGGVADPEALFALQTALATLWRSWGIDAAAVSGSGAGEFAAGASAGIFTAQQGMRLAAAATRGTQALSAALADVPLRVPSLRFVPAREGADASQVSYWSALRAPRDLAQATDGLARSRYGLFLVMGEEGTLRERPDVHQSVAASRTDATAHALAACFRAGVPVQWDAVDGPFANEHVLLPTYPFQKRHVGPDPIARRSAGEARVQVPVEAPSGRAALVARFAHSDVEAGERIVRSAFYAQLGAVLGLDAGELPDESASLSGLGLDSLMTADLRKRIEKELGVTLPLPSLLEQRPVRALCQETTQRLRFDMLVSPERTATLTVQNHVEFAP